MRIVSLTTAPVFLLVGGERRFLNIGGAPSGADKCDQLGDCGGDATLVEYESIDLEAALARNGASPGPRGHQQLRAQLRLCCRPNFSFFLDATKETRMAKHCKGVRSCLRSIFFRFLNG